MSMLGAWVHDISPFVLRISEDFGIRWYGLSYAASFLIGWLLLRWLAKRGATHIPAEKAWDAILAAVAGVLLGGRLGYVLFYQQSLLWTFSKTAPWWDVLAINKGGMASHGGMIGVIIAAWFVGRSTLKTNPPPPPGPGQGRVGIGGMMLHVLDTFALLTPSGLLLGRIANFVNGELLGRVASNPGETAPWWAVKFPQERLPDSGHIPALTPEQEFGLSRLIGETRLPGQGPGEGYRHLVDMIQHGRHDLAARLEPFLAARHPSQLYQAAAEGIVVGIVVWIIAARAHRPGVVGSMFFLIYGILRIITEQFWRLPDPLPMQHILGLTRGQWLSVGMIAVAVTGLWSIRVVNLPPMGGWRRREPTGV